MREGNATGIAQLSHLREPLTTQFRGECTQGIDLCQIRLPGAVLEHLDQAGFIERRVSVRWAGNRSHPTGDRGQQLGTQRALVFIAGFAQAYRQIHQTRHNHAPGSLDRLLGVIFRWRRAQGKNLP